MSVACLEPDEVEALLANGLDPANRERVDGHLDSCAGCRELVSHLAQLDVTMPADPNATRDERGSAPRVRGSRPIRIDRYIIDRKLGSGGMGVVFVADDPELARKVVIKVLRRDGGDDGSPDRHARMLREAQAMAKVSHPNVVPIYDVGEHDNQIYIVMELIDGADLGVWLRDKREVGEILDVFVAAGRGLAAAHRAGLVHRDFKPHNVMLAKTGEVKVTDFGLARSELVAASRAEPAALLDSPITQDGAVVGTPAYMAPEQIRGEAVDARADQFSYCVALYEAFYGERPFVGRTTREVLDSTLDGKLPAATVRGVPARVRRAIRRGLSVEPGARHASMDALLAELAPPKRARLAIVAGAGTLVAAGIAAALVLHGRGNSELCSGAAGEIAHVWNVPRRIAIERAFLATGSRIAVGAFDTTAAAIDDYSTHWRAGYTAACEATRVRGERSEAELDKRMYCFAKRRIELEQLLRTLAEPDISIVSDATDGAHGLPAPELCDQDTLVAPPDPSQRAEVDALTAEYAKATTQSKLLHFQAARTTLEAALVRAEKLGYKPLLVSFHISLAGLDRTEQQWTSAEHHVAECVRIAEELGDDATRADAYMLYIDVDTSAKKLDDAMRFAEIAKGVLHRLGDPPEQLAQLEVRFARLQMLNGDFATSRTTLDSALARVRAMPKPSPFDLADVYQSYAHLAAAKGDRAAQIDALRKAREQYAALDNAGLVASLDLQLSGIYSELGRVDEAATAGNEALARLREKYGTDDNDMFIAMAATHVMTLVRAKRGAEAVALGDRAVTATALRYGADHPQNITPLTTHAFALWKHRDYARADDEVGRAIAIAKRGRNPDLSTVAELTRAQGFLRHQQHRLDEALALLAEARAIIDKVEKPRSLALSGVLSEQGSIEVDRDHLAKARSLLEEALAIRLAQHADAGLTAGTQFELARAIWTSDPPRANQLIDTAEAASKDDDERLERITAFRAAHKR